MLKCSLALPPPPPSPSMSRFSWTAVVALLLAAPLVSGSSEGFLATRTQGSEDTAGSTADVDEVADAEHFQDGAADGGESEEVEAGTDDAAEASHLAEGADEEDAEAAADEAEADGEEGAAAEEGAEEE